MKEYLNSREQVLNELKSSENGLRSQEAAGRLEQIGPNKLAEGKKTTLLQRFLSQLADPMIIILIAAAVVSGITSFYSGESFADVIIIMIVVIINAVLGVVQESKAEKAIAALQEIAAATSKVIRDGQLLQRGAGTRRYHCPGSGRCGACGRTSHRMRQPQDRGSRPHRRVRSCDQRCGGPLLGRR